jgi:hypothetical protein
VILFPHGRRLRVAALVGAAALLVAAGCSKKNPPAPNVTEPPTASPSVQSVGDFQLAGPVDHAFQGIGPPLSVALAGVSLTPTPGASGPSGAAATTPPPAGGSPAQQGVMRVTLSSVSTTLTDKCGINKGDKVNVFWLTSTQFDAVFLNGASLEAALEGKDVGVAGSIFAVSDTNPQGLGLPTATPLPTGSSGALSQNCTLVADRVTSGGTTLPTARPHVTRTATPKPTHTPTPKPTHTPTPTPKPTHTPTPTPPTATPPTATP